MRRLLLTALMALSAAACSTDLESFAERYVTADERRFSVEYLRSIQAGDIESAHKLLVNDLRGSEVRAQLEAVRDILIGVPLDSLVLIGANVFDGPSGQRRVNLSYEVHGPAGYVVTNVSTRNSLVDGFSARPMQESLQTLNAFTLDDRGPAHFLWLAMLLAIPLTCITAALAVARTAGMPKRWLWVFVSLLAGPVLALWRRTRWRGRLAHSDLDEAEV